MNITVKQLTNLWDKLFDHIYLLWFTGHTDRYPKLIKELNRVGLYQTGKIEIIKIYSSGLKDDVLNATKYLWRKHSLCVNESGYDSSLNHHMVFNDIDLFQYKKSLILEDDVKFLISLDRLYEILSKVPEEYDICLFDKNNPFANLVFSKIESDKNNYINEEFYKYNNIFADNWSSACYALSSRGARFLIDIHNEFGAVPPDELLVRYQDDGRSKGIKRIYSKENICVQYPVPVGDLHWDNYKLDGIDYNDYFPSRIIPFDKCYCIHCVEDKEKYLSMIKEFDKLGILDSVEIRETSQRKYGENISKIFPHLRTKFYDSFLEKNANIYSYVLNVSLAHYDIIKIAYESNLNSVLIMEDDIEFIDDINIIYNYFDNLPKDYDVVKFFCYQKRSSDSYYIKDNKPFEWNICVNCYALSRKGMKKLIEIYENHLCICDRIFEEIDEDELNMYISNINLLKTPNKGSWLPEIEELIEF